MKSLYCLLSEEDKIFIRNIQSSQYPKLKMFIRYLKCPGNILKMAPIIYPIITEHKYAGIAKSIATISLSDPNLK